VLTLFALASASAVRSYREAGVLCSTLERLRIYILVPRFFTKTFWVIRVHNCARGDGNVTVYNELEVIRGLYESLNRPVEIKQIDLGLTSLLVIKGGLVRPVHTSESALALALIVSEPTVAASVNRLQGVKWVQKRSGKSRRVGNSYVVILENLPVAEELKRTLITPMARTIAESYMKAMPTNAKGRPRKYTKAERQRIAFALQTFLDKYTDGDGKLLCDVINFAMGHPKYAARVRKGPHELRRPFKKLLEEFKAGITQAAEPAKPTAPPEPVDPNAHPWDAEPLPSKTGQTVYKLQGLVAVGIDALRKLLSDANALRESEDCKLFTRTATESKEQRVRVVNFGGHWAVLDVKTGRGIDVEKAA
jgi:hypothetical protein